MTTCYISLSKEIFNCLTSQVDHSSCVGCPLGSSQPGSEGYGTGPKALALSEEG